MVMWVNITKFSLINSEMRTMKTKHCIFQETKYARFQGLSLYDNHKGTNNKDVGGCKRTLKQHSQGKWAHSSSPVTIPGWNCQGGGNGYRSRADLPPVALTLSQRDTDGLWEPHRKEQDKHMPSLSSIPLSSIGNLGILLMGHTGRPSGQKEGRC